MTQEKATSDFNEGSVDAQLSEMLGTGSNEAADIDLGPDVNDDGKPGLGISEKAAEKASGEEEEESEEGAEDETGDGKEASEDGEEEDEAGNEEETGADEAEEEESEESPLAQQVAELAGSIRELKAENVELRNQKLKAEDEAPIELEEVEFVTDQEQFDEFTANAEGLNKALNQARQKGALQAIEYMDKKIPGLVRKASTSSVTNAVAIAFFFRDNPDLRKLGDAAASYQDKVSAVYQSLEKKHPAKSVEEILGMLGPATRKAYKLKPRKTNNNVKTPPFPKGGGTGKKSIPGKPKPKSEASKIADEIGAMANL